MKIRKLDLIIVKVSSINNHFNREVNKMFKSENKVSLEKRLKQVAPQRTIYCHVKQFQSIDDDSLTLPDWMFSELKC